MRQKVNAAVAEVRAEVKEGRLTWCLNDIRRLIRPYPPHQHVDTILVALGEDTALEEGEQPYKDEEQGSDSGAASETSKWSDAEDYEAEGWSAAVAALPDDHAFAGNSDEELDGTFVPCHSRREVTQGHGDQERRHFSQKHAEMFDPPISDMSSGEDVDVRDSVWIVRVRYSCIGFTRFQ